MSHPELLRTLDRKVQSLGDQLLDTGEQVVDLPNAELHLHACAPRPHSRVGFGGFRGFRLRVAGGWEGADRALSPSLGRTCRSI